MSSAAEASAAAPPGGSVSVVVSEGLQLLLPLAGLFDVEKELKRLDKQKQKVRRAVSLVGACNSTGAYVNLPLQQHLQVAQSTSLAEVVVRTLVKF